MAMSPTSPQDDGFYRKSSLSTTTTTNTSPDDIKPCVSPAQWTVPPLPPIPDTAHIDMARWQRRSYKRDSYTSQSLKTPSTYSLAMVTNGDPEKLKEVYPEFSSRPLSAYRPCLKSTRRLQRPGARDWNSNWEVDPANPQNWSLLLRCYHTLTCMLVAFTIAFASATLAPFALHREQYFSVSPHVAALPQAVFLLGLALGPLTSAPSEVWGRRITFVVGMLLFAIFTLICALAHNYPGTVVARFLAGLFASSCITVGPAILFDVWAAGQRTLPTVLYVAVFALGAAYGALIGEIVVQYEMFRWTQYVILFASAVCLLTASLMRETSSKLIQRRKQSEKGRQKLTLPSLYKVIKQPFRILIRQPVVWISAISFSSNLAIFYALLSSVPHMFSTVYDFDWQEQGLLFFGLVAGTSVGLVLYILCHVFFYLPRRKRWAHTVEAEQGNNRRRASSRRQSAAALQSRRTSTMSRQSRPATRQSHRIRSIVEASPSREDPNSAEKQKYAGLAVAAADYINSLPANKDRQIRSESLFSILNKRPSFGVLCEELTKQSLTYDRAVLAKILIEAVDVDARNGFGAEATSPVGTAESQQPLLLDKDTHRAAAFAALEAPAPRPSSMKGGATTRTTNRRSRIMRQELQGSERPPPEWRLPPAVPGSVLVTSGIFMLAWTTTTHLPWIIPAVGFGVFGCGFVLVTISITLYFTDRYGAADAVSALTSVGMLGFAAAFVLSMFVLQMYENLGVIWATNVLAFLSLAVWVAPLTLTLGRSRFGRSSLAP